MLKLEKMRLYIGYKYTKIEDKESLIKNLLQLADGLEKSGHKTFLLGRDVQKWEGSLPLWKTLPAILGNMLKSDAFVAYVTSEVPSKGLQVELSLSKFLGKKKVILLDSEIISRVKAVPANTVVFQNTDDAIQKTLKELTSPLTTTPVQQKI